nr:VOC family protein [Carnobacterium maltaromaticum]
MKNTLIHHVSVINRDIQQSFQFYHNTLGLNLLLKTVNQDDNEMYHTFFGDAAGRPGTEFTVFEMKNGIDHKFGTNAIDRTVFLVPSEESLLFWEKRLNNLGIFNCEIESYNNSKILRFEDFDGVQLGFMPLTEKQTTHYLPRVTDEISEENAILGIHSIHLRVRYLEATKQLFKKFFDWTLLTKLTTEPTPIAILGNHNELFYQEVHLIEDKKSPLEVMGIGGTHHVAFSAKDEHELQEIQEEISLKNFLNSGIKNREFFKSLYFREANGILIEVATLDTHFVKENYEGLDLDQVPLYLPTFLAPKRSAIEASLASSHPQTESR